jgi:hypothetical protein
MALLDEERITGLFVNSGIDFTTSEKFSLT